MKKIIVLYFTTLMLSFFGFAQDNKIHLENIKENEDISKSLPRNVLYLFEDFIDGTIVYKDNETSAGKFNYNTILEEIQFISPEDKILTLAKPETVSYIIIGKSVFKPLEKRAFAQILVDGDVTLSVKRHTKYIETEKKVGAYGQSSITSSVETYNAGLVDSGLRSAYIKNLSNIRSLMFKNHDEYFIEYNGKREKIKKEKAVLKALPEYKKELSNYFSSHKVKFNNDDDLIRMTNFCNQMMSTIKH